MNTQIDLVRSSWALAAADPEGTSRLFYSNLFRIDTTTKPLFVGDLELQGRKLMETLSFVIDHLEDETVLAPAARNLAIRHVRYGVQKEQYASVGTALLATFDQLLGPQFTPAHREAWSGTYAALSNMMIDAAYAD